MKKRIKMMLAVALICSILGNVFPVGSVKDTSKADAMTYIVLQAVGTTEVYQKDKNTKALLKNAKKIKIANKKIATIKLIGKNRMKVVGKRIGDTHATVTYKNGKKRKFSVSIVEKDNPML